MEVKRKFARSRATPNEDENKPSLTVPNFRLSHEVDPRDYAALAVPGGFHSHGYDEAYRQPLHDLAKRIHGQGGTIATMCVGVLPVAETGLLQREKATSFAFSRRHDNLGRLRELGCIPTPGPIKVSNRIISCSGPD